MIKKGCLWLATVIFTGSFCTPAFSEGWREDSTGFWWENTDGSYPKSEWVWLDGNRDGIAECYYFDETGYMLSDTTAPGGYFVDASGAWVENGAVQTKTAEEAAHDAAASAEEAENGLRPGSFRIEAPEGYVLSEEDGAVSLSSTSPFNVVNFSTQSTEGTDYTTLLSEAERNAILDEVVQSYFTGSCQKHIVKLQSGSWNRYIQNTEQPVKMVIYIRYTRTDIEAIVCVTDTSKINTDEFLNEVIR